MSLINRLIGHGMDPETETKLPVAQAIAAFAEYQRGFITWSDMVALFALSEDEQASLASWFSAAGAGAFSFEELEHVLVLGERGLYDEQRVKDRLGIE